jgi:NAD(P)-dependent dehydrogenase (short-subunit alcohol dehydrogenase family)
VSKRQRVVLVTGSTRGIGLAIARKFHNNGDIIIQNGRNQASNAEILQNFELGDVSSKAQSRAIIDSVIKKFGAIDIVICNVGNGSQAESYISEEDKWNEFLKSNLFSATNIIEESIPYLLESKGSVVSISSIVAQINIDQAPIEYSCAKAALNKYITVMAKKHASKGVRFNVISPGNVFFEGSVWDRKLSESKKETLEYIQSNVPSGEFIQTDAIAEAVFFLCQPSQSSITGQVLAIDGGQTL